MHASSILALALGVAAVSATVLPDLETRDGACDPECNFPKSMTCSDNGGATLQKAEIVAAVRNSDRSGKPYEADASNISSEFCSMRSYRGIPFWTGMVPGPNGPVASMYYALAANGTFYFCGTTSGMDPSGWPGRCEYNN